MPMRVITVRRWEVFVAFIGISALFIVMGLVLGHEVSKNRKTIRAVRAEDTRLQTVLVGVCALRSNLDAQITASQHFLADLRSGRRQPIPGISETDIALSIAREQQSLDALALVHCQRRH